MPHPIRTLGVLSLAFGLLAPIVATAWTPYGYGPPGAADPAASGYGMSPPPFFGSGYPPAGPFGAPSGFAQPSTEAAPTAETPPAVQDQPVAPQAAPEGLDLPAAPGPFDAGSPSYGYGPPPPTTEPAPGAPPSGYGRGSPPPGFFGPGAPFSGPEGYGMPPAGFPGGRYGYGSDRPGMQVSRRTTEDAYLLDIQLRGMRPDEVQVRAQGRWITIDRVSSAQEVREEQLDQGRGYARSFSYSSGTASRRMTLPPDADTSAMQREDGESSIRIRFPRTERGFGYGTPPQR